MSNSPNKEPHKSEPLGLSAIEAGLSAVRGKGTPDENDVMEVSDLEDDRLREEIANLKSDRKLREKYGDRILRFLEWYAIGVGALIVLSGVSFIPFSLPETALVTLVGSTAIAAIGLVGFVAKGLFGNGKNSH
ncbi:MAG: hypothetical protein L3J33_06760 [Rhodobacteraceae bacterium]|nr:hypothetical protein [Paracoccaceae bacterium]